MKKFIFIFVLNIVLLSLGSCENRVVVDIDSMSTTNSSSSETDKMFFIIGSAYGILLNDITLIDVRGGAMGYPASLDEVDNYILGLNIGEVTTVKDNYEIVAIYDEKENIILTFAYSYTSKQVYIYRDNVTYQVNNPEGLQLWLGKLLCQYNYYYNDLKIFWVNEIINPVVDLGNGNWFSNNFSFRYERYFGLTNTDTEDIFYSIKGYMNTATDEREMIVNLAEAMNYQTYHAIIAYDDLTGYWRVELYSDNVDVLVYLDNTFKILWCCYIN